MIAANLEGPEVGGKGRHWPRDKRTSSQPPHWRRRFSQHRLLRTRHGSLSCPAFGLLAADSFATVGTEGRTREAPGTEVLPHAQGTRQEKAQFPPTTTLHQLPRQDKGSLSRGVKAPLNILSTWAGAFAPVETTRPGAQTLRATPEEAGPVKTRPGCGSRPN